MWSMKLFMRLSLLLLSNGSTTLGYEIKQLWQNFAYHGKIADFGDYDRNGQLDALSYHSRGRVTSIYVHTVPDETNTTKLLATVDVQGNVDGIIGVDVNLDGALDILVVVKERTNKYRMLILYQDIITGKLTAGWNSTTEPNLHNTGAEKGYNHMRRSYEYTSIHPIVLDINGDGFADFLCQTVDKRLFAWVSSENTLIPYLLENIPLCTFDGPLHGYIPSPHSSAFVDIDGDCRSDLVLLIQDGQNRYLQIWQSHVDNNQTKYVSDESMNIQLPKNHGQVSFVDINGDGTIDIAVPYCTKVDSSGRCIEGSNVAMSLNRQKPFCSYIWNNPNSDMCRKATELCSRSKFTFKPLHETAPISISLPKGLRFHWIENCPLTLSFGDLNNNGFPDLILLAYDVIKAKPLVMVYKNVDTDKPADIYTRSFEQSGNIDILDVYYDDLRVTAVDLFEDGITEIAVFGSPGSNQTDSIGKFYTVVNESIGLFMKAMIKATSNDATPSVNVLSTGSNVNGAVFKITVIDVYGAKSPRCSTIRPQSAHSPLLPPYSMFGLGKTNNYVEEFYLGMPSKSENHSNMWISIIPNCSVIAIPHRLFYPNEWTLKLSLSPSKDIFKILIATLICLVSLGVVIVGFDIKEKREDSEQEKGFRQKFIIN